MSPWIIDDAIRGIGGIVFAYLVMLVARLMQRRTVQRQDRDLGIPPRHER
jgi:hypothetical protein